MSASEDWGSVGPAGGNHQPPIVHTVVILGKQSLPWRKDSPAAGTNLTAVAVVEENQVNGIPGQHGEVFRVLAQGNLILRCREKPLAAKFFPERSTGTSFESSLRFLNPAALHNTTTNE